MTKKPIRIKTIGAKINDTSEEVFSALFDDDVDVVIGASAGTGKTTLLTNILAEAVIREIESGNVRPFDSIVAVTFTVEAARQMKKKARELLTSYNEKHPIANFETLLYSLEKESWISTIDSLTQKILKLVALERGLPPEIDVIDSYDEAQIRREVLDEVRTIYSSDYDLMESITNDRTSELLSQAYKLLSMYVISPDEFINRLKASFDLFYSQSFAHKENLKDYNLTILEAFERIVRKYIALLRKKYQVTAKYGYDDIRREIVEFFRSSSAESKEWQSSFGNRFSLLLIDEFQDTSYAQTEFLSFLVGEGTRIFLIGDVKQSIFTWRNAEPRIFSSIVESAMRSDVDIYFHRHFRYLSIHENYRSLEPLVRLTNFFFSEENSDSIFENPRYTGGLLLPHPPLYAKTVIPSKDPPTMDHIHYFFTNSKGHTDARSSEAEFVLSMLQQILSGLSKIKVRRETDEGVIWDDPMLGDCAILIRARSSKLRRLKQLLISEHIPYVMIQDQGFYKRPEISLMIDFLDWLGDPFRNEALLRILRSPFIGASDFLLRVISDNRFRLDLASEYIKSRISSAEDADDKKVMIRDLVALRRVMNLKRNLRWSREGRKASLVEAILQSSHFREILMTYPEGEQCVANLGMLCDIVDSWEDEELISYRELINRLKYYRTASPDVQNQAVLADIENDSAVKIATIHSTKGLEFPIVFIYDVDDSITSAWSRRNSITGFLPMALVYHSDNGHFIHLRQFVPEVLSEQLQEIDDIYKTPMNGFVTDFKNEILSIYNSFISEKWRLYYVALTRARDHIFHTYNSREGYSMSWGNEFRDRIQQFIKQDPANHPVRRIKSLPREPSYTRDPASSIEYKKNKVLNTIEHTFFPSIIDPTHVYDLLFCPRRYQYGSLMNAAGKKCDDLSNNSFSPVFGTVIHKMIEKFDFVTGNTKSAKDLLATLDFVNNNVRRLVLKAIDVFVDFAKQIGLVGADSVISEKPIYVSFDFNGRRIEFRGVIDLLVVSDRTIKIYDIKTNYPLDNPTDSDEVRLFNEFIRKHHHYQLLTYKAMLKKMGYSDIELYILSLSKRGKQLIWDKFPVNESVDVISELVDILPLKVVESGLDAKKLENRSQFCNICEYKDLCTN